MQDAGDAEKERSSVTKGAPVAHPVLESIDRVADIIRI